MNGGNAEMTICVVRGCQEISKARLSMVNGDADVCDEHLDATREIAEKLADETKAIIWRAYREVRALGQPRGMADPGELKGS